ncbi:MAG: hypothetical protein B7X90_01925 [Novosphingobium sp. 17-62-19]|nr:MAG: hypothetical protein B7X90_01925 [Novosphingobium sp. 17-62-19]
MLDTGQGFLRRAINRVLGRTPSAPPKSTHPEPVEGPRPEDKSWQAGDIAECIVTNDWIVMRRSGVVAAPGPAKGDVHIVNRVMMSSHPMRGEIVFLALRGLPGWWEAACFRKIQPVADKAEAADSTFLKDLHHRLARQPVREREDA